MPGKVDQVEKDLKTSVAVNMAYALVQLAVGALVGSLAIVSNGGHTLTDSISIAISLLAARVSRRRATPTKTYGYGKSTFIAAFINSAILVAFVVYIFYTGYLRLVHPVQTSGGAIIVTSAIGIVISGSIAYLLLKHRADLNAKSVFMHMVMDSLTLVGSIIAGILIILTGSPIFDSLISFIIGFVMLFAAFGIIKDSLNMLMEGVPSWIDPIQVKKLVSEMPKIKEVHDLHVWAISSGSVAMSCHVVMEDCSLDECTRMVYRIRKKLSKEFGISHATIESEVASIRANHKKMHM